MTGEVRSQKPSTKRPIRVLVVDDNTAGAETLAMLLNMLGYESEVALSGRSALEACHRAPPHIVLLDLTLPDINGFEVAQMLRGSADTKHSLIIALSGASPDVVASGAQGAFDYHLTKPVSIDVLEDLLKKSSDQAASSNERPVSY